MRITKIHLFNFRSVEDLTLDVADDGMHLIHGAFGAGKSSFLTGVRFALFGDNGEAGTNLDLRRRGSDDDSEAGCEVTFTHGQDTYVARRWLRRVNQRKGPTEKAHAALTINGNPVDGVTASKLTKLMEETLGLTAKAFTSASMIPQGEVATLMKATPGEVQNLIERHTGLDQLTRTRDKARKAATAAEANAEAMPGNLEDVWELETQCQDADEHVAAHTATANTARATADEATARAREAQSALDDLHRAARAAAEYERRLTSARTRADLANEQVDSIAGEAAAAGVNLTGAGEERNRLAEMDSRLESLVRQGQSVAGQRNRRDETSAACAQARQRLSTINDAAASLPVQRTVVERKKAELHQQREEVNREIESAHGRFTVAEANVERLTKALSTLRHDGGDGHQCPTCQQQVEDPESLTATLQTALTQAQQVRDQARNDTVAARTRNRSLDEQATSIAAQEQKMADLAHQVEAAERDLANAEEAHKAQVASTADAEATLADMLAALGHPAGVDVLATARDAHSTLNQQRTALAANLQIARRHQQAVDAAQQAAEAVAALQDRPVDSPSDEDLDAAATRAAAARGEAEAAAAARGEAERELSAAEAAANMVKYQLKEAKTTWKLKQDAATAAAVARGEADVLEALRRDLLADYTSSISRSATDMLAGFGGEFVAFHLDEEFVPKVELADGTLVRTAILSGGEAALAGLACRIGLTLHITGGGMPEQLIGDEVTNYLDEEGRRAVLGQLNKIFPSVLVISHTSESRDYATRVHHVVRPELGSTQWADSATVGAAEPDNDQEAMAA